MEKVLCFILLTNLIYIVGLPLYGLMAVSLVYYLVSLYKKQVNLNELFIPFTFLAFFVAHSLFWYFGIFASMGLKRVLIGVVPLMGIMTYHGYTFILHLLGKTPIKIQLFFKYGILSYILIFPFTPNPAAINFTQSMYLDASQALAQKVAKDLQKKGLAKNRVISENTYFDLIVPEFDILYALGYKDFTARSGYVYVYDCFYSNNQKEKIQNNPKMKFIERYTALNEKGQEIYYIVYQII
jgi:hypothetical protein